MSSTCIQDLLSQKRVLLADGAMGTNLFAMGLQSGDAPEPWNMKKPDLIEKLHQTFVDSGSDWLLTNSFGGTSFRLKLHKLEGEAFELNKSAAERARTVVDRQSRPILVVGSMGPTGEILEPLGSMTREACVEAFRVQALGLKAGGADVLCFETISAPEELSAAVEGAREARLPIAATMSFDTAGRTMMGLTPADFVALGKDLGLSALGANCGVGGADLLASLLHMHKAENADTPLIAMANCGIPEFVNGEIRYSGTTDVMRSYCHLAAQAGASIIGGCCGTTALHVAAMRDGLDKWLASPTHAKDGAVNLPSLDVIEQQVGPVNETAKGLLDQGGGLNETPQRRSNRKRARLRTD